MKQKIVLDYPPNYNQLKVVFPIVGQPIIFSWGDRIYNPNKVFIPAELIAHEGVHGDRQGVDEACIQAWWDKYIEDTKFRLYEEILAHKAEFEALTRRHSNKRAANLLKIATKLAAPLYESLVSIEEAKQVLLERNIER
jgi:hypothetical protein